MGDSAKAANGSPVHDFMSFVSTANSTAKTGAKSNEKPKASPRAAQASMKRPRPLGNGGLAATSMVRSSSAHVLGRTVLRRAPSWAAGPRANWRSALAIEERDSVRTKIQKAYDKVLRFDPERPEQSYNDLLRTCVAMEEQWLHMWAPGKLDYLKSGYEYEQRLRRKRDHLTGNFQHGGQDGAARPKKPRREPPPKADDDRPSTAAS